MQNNNTQGDVLDSVPPIPSSECMARCYTIAGCTFYVWGKLLADAVNAMPGFSPFLKGEVFGYENLVDGIEGQNVPIFHVRMAESAFEGEKQCQYTFQSDGVDSFFYAISEGYLLTMKHDDGTHLCVWSDTNSRTLFVEGNLAPQMLRFALWTGFGIMTVGYGRIPVHGSCIVCDNRAYLFLGESGTGKSTHTRLWREFISGSFLLNDDSPIIVSEADEIFIYGSPWSGKTPCYKAERYPLGGCVRLSQAPFNKMERLSFLKSYAALHPSCPPEFAYDDILYAGISKTLEDLLDIVPIYHLACLPDEAAATLSHRVLSNQ